MRIILSARKHLEDILDLLTLEQLAEARGKDVLSSDGVKIGSVEEVIYDYLNREPVWIGVRSERAPHFRTLLVPARGATYEGETFKAAFSESKIEGQPPASFGAGFDSLSEENGLYDYFGLAWDHEPELRVLLAGDDLPSMERTTSEYARPRSAGISGSGGTR
jgi:hypothetical protein